MTSLVIARADGPHAVSRPAETGEQRLAGFEGFHGAAGDDYEILLPRHGARSAHARVEKADSPLREFRAEPFRVFGTRSRGVRDDQPGRRALRDAVGTKDHFADDVAVRKRREHPARVPGRGCRRLHGRAATLVELARALLVDVEALHREPALQQVVRERLPHQSHADDTHAIAHRSILLSIGRTCPMMPQGESAARGDRKVMGDE
jgi:hypothetical protein